MTIKTQKIIDLWSERAWAYDKLAQDYAIFGDMSDRLVDKIESPLMESVIDLGAGTGVLAGRILAVYPNAEVHLFEPSEAMLALAERHLGAKVLYHQQAAEEAFPEAMWVSSVMSNAVMHMLDREVVFKSVAAVLRSGGVFAFNLWWHAFNETADDQAMENWWREPVEQALAEIDEKPPKWPDYPPAKKASRKSIEEKGRRYGLKLESITIDHDEVDKAFSIDFMAMDKDWPKKDLGGKRKQVIERAKELAGGIEIVKTVRVLLRKVQGSANQRSNRV